MEIISPFPDHCFIDLIYIPVPVSIVSISPVESNSVVNVIKNDTQTFTCTTGFSRPSAWIQWYIGEKNVTNQSQLHNTQTTDYSNSSSTLHYKGNNNDHKKNIHCAAANIEGKTKVNSTEIKIYIQSKY